MSSHVSVGVFDLKGLSKKAHRCQRQKSKLPHVVCREGYWEFNRPVPGPLALAGTEGVATRVVTEGLAILVVINDAG